MTVTAPTPAPVGFVGKVKAFVAAHKKAVIVGVAVVAALVVLGNVL